jgi:RimJ/RimL family protein N-acetyltransferase
VYGPVVETIETQRLVLEPLAVTHAEEMDPVLNDRRLHVHMGGEPLTLPELKARYARLANGPGPFHQEGWLNWIVRRRRDAQAIGTVQATVTPGDAGPQAAVAWVIGVPYQGFGFASEAAAALVAWLQAYCVKGIYATINPANTPSEAVARRIGLLPTETYAGDELVWRLPPDKLPTGK